MTVSSVSPLKIVQFMFIYESVAFFEVFSVSVSEV